MKVKDIERTANVAWSPKNQHPIYLAAGTAAQQLDASFNTSAALELYSLNLTDPDPNSQPVCSVKSDHRFHKIIWGSYGNTPNSVIVGGCDGGLIQIYNANELLKGGNGIIGKHEKHAGPVHALDFNKFQQNLFASGAGESEIFIWDLNNTSAHMSPGTKSQPLEDVLSVSWNLQVQHILASTFPTKCVIWDLRKNEPIIKLTDTVSRIRWKVVSWHPEVATQLCLASEEDQAPVIQLWDLRFATAPLKILQNHQRGILSMSWCSEDPDLLVSCAKDNRIVCWNPNSNVQNGEVLAEIATTNQWSFDVVWCPKNPALIAAPNFDGHVSVYSVMGGRLQQIQTTNKIADSFPGMDGYAEAPVPQQDIGPVSVNLSKPPKWLKKSVGAKFGFGGKLITFEHDKTAFTQAMQNLQPGQQPPHIPRTVQISQVITEGEFVKKSSELEKSLEYGNFTEYCETKSEQVNDPHKKYIWDVLRANFQDVPRVEMLNLLGYNLKTYSKKLDSLAGIGTDNNIDGLNEDFTNLNRIDDFNGQEEAFNFVNKQQEKNDTKPFKINTSDDSEGLIAQALLLNNVNAAVELCFKAKRYADALIIATTGGPDLVAKTQLKYLEQNNDYVSTLISAIVSEDCSLIIDNCDINNWKEALVAVFTHASDNDLPVLCEQLGNRLEEESKNNPELLRDAHLCYICAGSFDKLVTSWSEHALKSTEALQELIELVTFLQKAIERQGRQVKISGGLADLLFHYASLLASQGELTTAIAYLGSSNNEKISSLRSRLQIALGQSQVHAQEIRQQSRRGSQRTSFTSYPNTNTFNNNPFQQTTSTNANFVPHVPQSPSPSLSASGLQSRNKYVLDPSVSSSPYDTRGQFPPQPINSFQQGPASNNFPPLPPGNSYYNSAPEPLPNQTFNSGASLYNPAANQGFNPAPLVPQTRGFEPTNNMPPPPLPAEIGQPALNPGWNAPSGWNDPPPLSTRSAKKPPTTEMSHSEPITHPLYGTAPVQPQPMGNFGDVGAPPRQPYSQPYYPQNPPMMLQPQPTQADTFNVGNFNQNAVSNVSEPPQEVHNPPRTRTPQVVQKAPIPEEHLHMKTVLDEFKDQCSCAANNPQTKRKLDDVGRKLETLYDSLREQKLSPNTLASLHEMVQMIQLGNYTGGLALHTQMVSGPDFAQLASFMPGLKVLLQCALQLQVYLR
ncbi:unnamed protein product [Phyllotreta striolata]|uniref:Protein transport protein Sec31A n=1 Tax=Phyllotreta striolata TaxID=444603 RepID=A0A9N9TGS2_PHYSR|nr:unnamed protein product [Phyllotreta striolata]